MLLAERSQVTLLVTALSEMTLSLFKDRNNTSMSSTTFSGARKCRNHWPKHAKPYKFQYLQLDGLNQTVRISIWIETTIRSGVTSSLTCCSSMLFFSTGSTFPTGDKINDSTKPSCTHILPRQKESHRMSWVSEKKERNDCCGNPCHQY